MKRKTKKKSLSYFDLSIYKPRIVNLEFILSYLISFSFYADKLDKNFKSSKFVRNPFQIHSMIIKNHSQNNLFLKLFPQCSFQNFAQKK